MAAPITGGSIVWILDAETGEFNKALIQAEQNAKKTSENVDRSTKKTAQSVGKNLQQVGESLASTGKKMSLLVTAPVVAGFAASVKSAGTFESAMSQLRQASGATTDQMGKFGEVARKLGADSRFAGVTAQDVTNVMVNLSKAGLDVNNTLGATEGVLALAKAGNIEFAQAATIAASSLNAFNLRGDQANQVADALAAAANASQAELGDLALGLQQSATVAKMFGLDLNENATALAIFANNGLRASDAGTSLKTMLLNIATPTKQQAKLMKEIGFEAYDAQGKFVGLGEMSTRLKDSLKGMTDQQKQTTLGILFGSDAVRAASVLTSNAGKSWDEMSTKVGKSGAAVELAAAQMGPYEKAMEGFKNAISELALTVGQQLLPALTGILKSLSSAVNWFSELPEGVKAAAVNFGLLVAALGPLLFVGGKAISTVGKLGSALGVLSKASAASSPAVIRGSVTAAKSVTMMAEIIGKALPAMAKASLGIAMVGAAIGVAIGAVGGGIWVLGKGLSAIGDGMADIADGAVILQKVDLSRLSQQIAGIGMAFSGLAPKILDLGAAALTFPLIGKGLMLMSAGLKQLQHVQVDSITQKLPALAGALKEFQIGFIESVFSGNIISKFSNLGNALVSISKVVNMVSNLKIDSGELKRNLSNLASGLKAFLIPEIQPSWINNVFGQNVIKPQSVTAYMTNLKDIIDPIQSLQKLFNAKKFNADELKSNLEKLASGLKAFLIGEVQASWINKTFGGGQIKVASVTKYMGTLKDIIQPLNNLQKVFMAKKFDSGKLESNLKDLATGLKAFLIPEVQPSWLNKTFGEGTVKVSSVLSKLNGFKDLASGLSVLQGVFQAKKFDSKKFTEFISQLGKALQSFLTTDIEKSLSSIAGSSSFKSTTKGTLQYFNNFVTLADGLNKLNSLVGKKNFDQSKFTSFIKSLGNALKAFTVSDITQETSEFMGSSAKISSQTSSILQHFQNFGVLADGIIKLQTLFANKKFNPTAMTTFLEGLGTALQSFGVSGIKTKISSFLVSSDTQTTYTTVLEHLGDFGKFAGGISTLVNTIFSKNIKFNSETFGAALTSIGNVLKKFGAYNTNSSASMLLASTNKSTTYTNVLEHLGDFSSFASGIKTLINAISAKGFNIDTFTAALSAIGSTLKEFTLKLPTIEQSALLVSSKKSLSYTSVLEHLGNFKNFASGIKTIADVVTAAKFDPGKFKTALTTIFESLKSLALQEQQMSESGFFSSSSSSVSYTSVVQKIGDIQGLANAVKTLSATGVGTKAFNGEGFKTAMSAIAAGLKSLLSIGSADFGSIDVGKLNGIGSGIKSIRSAIAGWNTSGLGAMSGQISGFIKTFSNSLVTSISGKASAMRSAGTALMSNLATGIRSGAGSAKQAAEGLGTQFIAGINSKQNAVRQAGVSLQGAMWHGIEPKMRDEYYQGAALANQLVNGIKSKIGAARSAGQNATQGFINGANSLDVYSVGGSIASKFLQGLKDKGKQGSPWKTTKEIGGFAAQGFVSGISSNERDVVKASHSMADAVIGTVEKDFQIASPSKVMKKIGGYIGAGIGKGLRGSATSIKSAASKISSTLKKAFKDKDISKGGLSKTLKALTKNTSKLTSLTKKRASVVSQLAKAEDKLKDLKTQKSDYATALTQSLIGEVNTKQFSSVTDYLSSLNEQALKLTRLKTVLTQLKGLGLANTVYEELAQGGTESLGLAESILAGGKATVTAVNTVKSQITTTAKGIGSDVSSTMYDAGIKAAQGIVNGLKSQQKAIEKQMNSIASSMAKTIKKALKIKSPSRIMAAIGRFIGQGLAIGIDKEKLNVVSTARGMAEDVVNTMSGYQASSMALAPTGYETNSATAGGAANSGVTINQTNNVYTELDMKQVNRNLTWELNKK